MVNKVVPEKIKIAVITGTRAEYGLLYWLMREIQEDPELQLQLIVTGMHLSPEFGMTYKLIEADGFKIDAKVEMLLSSDTSTGIAKSIGLGVIGFADAISFLNPDIMVILGDRFEALAAAQVGLAKKIPIAHIHGGEVTEGAIDDAIRHCITKMSHLHFVAADAYRKRVIQLGENPKTVFNVGTLGLERIKKMKLLTPEEWENKFNFSFGQTNFLVTYHPVTLQSHESNVEAIKALFDALDHFPQTKVIFTKGNADESGRFINDKIDEYVAKNPERAVSFINLGDLNYLSLMQFVDAVIGNSSSGLTEAPYFKKPTINIGERQAKRLKANSVIDCTNDTDDIISAIKKSLTKEFQLSLNNVISPYGQAATASKIKDTIKNSNLKKLIIKHFYDLQTEEVLVD